jgi:hypothetical protein
VALWGGAFSFIKKDNPLAKRPFIICFVIYPPFLNYLLRTVFFYKWHGDGIDISPLIHGEAEHTTKCPVRSGKYPMGMSGCVKLRPLQT